MWTSKTNGKATGKPSPLHPKWQSLRKSNREGNPSPLCRKQPEMRRRGVPPSPSHRKPTATEPVSHPRCVESKCQRKGFPIHVASKTNGNAPPVASKMNTETQRGQTTACGRVVASVIFKE